MADQPHSLSRTAPSTQLTTSSPEWIALELGRIAILMGEEITKERLSLMVNELVSIEPKRLGKAFARVRRELKFFPKLVEILERLPARRYGIFAEDEDDLWLPKPN